MKESFDEITPSSSVVKSLDEAPSTLPSKRFSFKFPALRFGRPKKGVVVILSAFLGILVVLGLILGIPAFKAYNDSQVAISRLREVRTAIAAQDLKLATEKIKLARTDLKKVKEDVNLLGWSKVLPIVGSYTSDATHLVNAGEHGLEAAEIMIVAVEPYQDILGLKGQPVGGGTTEEKIAKLVETLDKVAPELDKVAVKVDAVEKELQTVDPNRYPETFRNVKVRENLEEAKTLVILADQLLTEARPMIKKLPKLLGVGGEAKYMILFQNDKEIRPTGGFITAYAVFRVNNGKISLEAANDIYKLDDTITKRVAPPDIIKERLLVYGWNIRDANFSPDFEESMKNFEDIYANSREKKTLDGIIAVDTHLLVRMMDVLDGVEIYGTKFTTKNVDACDCPMVVYELLKAAGTPRGYWVDNRKDMIGVLLQALLRKAFDAPSEVNAPLFQAAWEEAKEKHILVYLHDPDAQRGVEALGFAGKIQTFDGDYLHINDANLGGAKSNLFITQSVTQTVTASANGTKTTLTIEYKYPRAGDNCSLERKEGLCLAGIYRDYLRVYLPKGTKVTEVRGFENKSKAFEDLGHTVVDGFFTIVPQGFSKIIINYESPITFKNGQYRSLIQKQPGTEGNRYKVVVNNTPFEFNLTQDKELVTRF